MGRSHQVFIGSSPGPAEEIATAVKAVLEAKGSDIVARHWRDAFDARTSSIDSLFKLLAEFDFGVFVLTPDDLLNVQGSTREKPQSTVLLDFGLFFGRFGPERTFVIAPDEANRIPSDLRGVTIFTYALAN